MKDGINICFFVCLFVCVSNETGFSEVTLVLVVSSAGLLVTAASSAAPCVQSWQMCSGTDVTRPNLEPWSKAFLKGPEQSHCPLLLPLHCLSLLSIDNQQPHPKGPKTNPALIADWLAGFEPPPLLNPALHPSHPSSLLHSSITAQLDGDTLNGLESDLISQGQTEKCHLGC